MRSRGSIAVGASLCLAVPCAAEEPPKSYEEEVAERAALTAFLRSEPISVIGLVQGSDNSSGDAERFVEVCQSWKMTQMDVVGFFKTGNAMPGEEWHHRSPSGYSGGQRWSLDRLS